MHKRILVPRVGTAFAGVVLSRVQMPARLVNACCNRVEIELVKAPLGLRNSVTDNQLATADA
jgi:hypothetical protein